MGTKTCTSCYGQGVHISTITIPDYSPGSGPAFKTIQEKSRCPSCGGNGYIVTYDPPPPVVQKPRIKTSPNTSGNRRSPMTENPSPTGTSGLPAPTGLDAWFERFIPKEKRRTLTFLFCGIFALIGYSIAPSEAVGMYSIVGTIFGIFFIPIIYYSIKLLYFSFIVLVGCGLLYLVYLVIKTLLS